MPRTAPLLFLLFISVSARPADQTQSDQHLIDQLKNTPVNQIEAGLARERFDSWFKSLVKPRQIGYEVKELDTVAHTLSVIAYTEPPQPGWRRGIQIRFAVDADASAEKANRGGTVKPSALRFSMACEGPTNPRMRRPDHCFSKLSDLERYLHGSRMASSPSKISP
jgi:hypothetical protein